MQGVVRAAQFLEGFPPWGYAFLATVVSVLLLNQLDPGDNSILATGPWFGGLFCLQLIAFMAANSFAERSFTLGWREALFAWIATVAIWLLCLPLAFADANYTPGPVTTADHVGWALIMCTPVLYFALTLVVGFYTQNLRRGRLFGYATIACAVTAGLGIAVLGILLQLTMLARDY
jgi:hypothetical protein